MKVLIYHCIDSRSPNDMDREMMAAHLNSLQLAAEEAGHSVIGTSCDFANGLTVERPGLTKTLKAIDTGIAEGVFVKDLSRLARTWSISEQFQQKLQSVDGCLLTVEPF